MCGASIALPMLRRTTCQCGLLTSARSTLARSFGAKQGGKGNSKAKMKDQAKQMKGHYDVFVQALESKAEPT